MNVKVCDYCGEEIAGTDEFTTVTAENADGNGTRSVGHFHLDPYPCARKLGDMFTMLRELGEAVYDIPVASPQKVAALRRKHKKG